MDISYELNQYISSGNDEVFGFQNYDYIDWPFNSFINALELEGKQIPAALDKPANISKNDNIIVEINKNQDFVQSGNSQDNSIRAFSGRKRKNPIKEGDKIHDKFSLIIFY